MPLDTEALHKIAYALDIVVNGDGNTDDADATLAYSSQLEKLRIRLGNSTLERDTRIARMAEQLIDRLNPSTLRYVDPTHPLHDLEDPDRPPLNDNHSMLVRLGDLRDLFAAVKGEQQ